jgi:hypothetical protein
MSKEQNITFLVDMGFPRELAAKAIQVEGYLEPAIQYCVKYSGGQSLGSGGGGGGGGQSLGGSNPQRDVINVDEDDVDNKMEVEEKPKEEQRKLTEEEKAEALRKIQERIKERKDAAAKAEELSDMQKEKMRRTDGQEAQKTKEEYERKKAERESYLRKKAKEDDIKAREAILAKLAQDKLNKEAEMAKKNAAVVSPSQQQQQGAVETAAAKNYDECVLQIRLPDNSKIQHTFLPSSTMADVVAHIRLSSPQYNSQKLVLSTTFPRKSYEGPNLSTTLKDAELVPRGMLLVTIGK